MKNPKYVLLFLLAAATATVGFFLLPKFHNDYLSTDPIETEFHHESLTNELIKKLNITPIKLLEYAKHTRTNPSKLVFAAGYPIPDEAKGDDRMRRHLEWWISKEDVKELAKRIDSKSPCVRIYGSLTNETPAGYSTEGVESARLIYGFMHPGWYPANSWPGGYYSDNSTAPLIKEVKRWLRENHISTTPS